MTRQRKSEVDQARPAQVAGAYENPEQPEHPRGTLAIVGLFGVFFALAWLATYLFVFLQRGALHP